MNTSLDLAISNLSVFSINNLCSVFGFEFSLLASIAYTIQAYIASSASFGIAADSSVVSAFDKYYIERALPASAALNNIVLAA